MAHTLPDYTTKYKMTKVFASVDNNELAARLGSPVTYDRRGNVVWMDDFENGFIHWSKQSVVAPAVIDSCVGHCYTGSTSMRMATDGLNGDLVYVEKYFPLLYSSSIGFEAMVNTATATEWIDIIIWGYTGTHKFVSNARWIPTSDTIQYRDSAAVFQDLSTSIGGGDTATAWMPIKLVVDHSTDYYKRILIGNNEFDCSTYTMQKTADARNGFIIVRIQTWAKAAGVKTVYFDNVIITQNED